MEPANQSATFHQQSCLTLGSAQRTTKPCAAHVAIVAGIIQLHNAADGGGEEAEAAQKVAKPDPQQRAIVVGVLVRSPRRDEGDAAGDHEADTSEYL